MEFRVENLEEENSQNWVVWFDVNEQFSVCLGGMWLKDLKELKKKIEEVL